MNDPYCYENCEVLRNKLGIRNDEELSKAEVEFSCNAIHELGTTPLEGDYDFAHLCAIHNRMKKKEISEENKKHRKEKQYGER